MRVNLQYRGHKGGGGGNGINKSNKVTLLKKKYKNNLSWEIVNWFFNNFLPKKNNNTVVSSCY